MSNLRAIAHLPLILPSPLERYRAGAAAERRLVDGDLILTAGQGGGPEANLAVVLGPLAPDSVGARAAAFYAGDGYSVALDAEAAPAMEAALRAQGWELDEEEPGLVLTPIPPGPPPPAELTIRRVTTEADLDDFMRLSATARRWVPSLAAATDPDVALLVGYVGGEAVATARIAGVAGVGDITGVTTLPGYRRRGFGTAMTWAVIAEGTRRGCTAMTLTATELGYPVYVKLGFVPVCTFRTFVPPTPPG